MSKSFIWTSPYGIAGNIQGRQVAGMAFRGLSDKEIHDRIEVQFTDGSVLTIEEQGQAGAMMATLVTVTE